MPGTAVDLGTGTTVTFGTSGYNAELLSVSWTGISRQVVDTTPLSITAAPVGQIGNRRYKAAHAVDPGSMDIEFHFNPNLTPPISGVSETITLTFPIVSGDLTAAKWVCAGQMISFEIAGISLDEKMTARTTVKLTGSIAITAAT